MHNPFFFNLQILSTVYKEDLSEVWFFGSKCYYINVFCKFAFGISIKDWGKRKKRNESLREDTETKKQKTKKGRHR